MPQNNPMSLARLFFFLGFFFLAAPASAETIIVSTAAGLQAAVNRAVPGDTVVLQAGTRFVGQFKLPAKTGTVTLTSSAVLPSRRIGPSDSPLLPIIASADGTMALDLTDAKNWKIDGVKFDANPGGFGEVIAIERGENIELRRLLLDLQDNQEQKRFILGNGRNITLADSYCSRVWRTGQDSQCFVAWNGGGPYKITNNFLSAASENLMFGGADSLSPDNIPSDILIENNLFTKPSEWKGDGVSQVIKNLFELKSAQRVIVRNNVFDGNWSGEGQSGSAIVFTPRNQDGKAPWSVVRDVLFENNTVRNSPTIFNISGYDEAFISQQTTGIVIRKNLLIGDGGGRMAVLGNEIGSLTLSENIYAQPPNSDSTITFYAEGAIATATGSRTPLFAIVDLVMTYNKMQFNLYGLHSAVGFGSAALKAMVQSPTTWSGNVFGGGQGWENAYPAGTTFLSQADFVTATTTPVEEEPPTPGPVVDPAIADLTARVQALENKVSSLSGYLAATPDMSKIQQLIRYLRMIPR
jgi:hypothetical protein